MKISKLIALFAFAIAAIMPSSAFAQGQIFFASSSISGSGAAGVITDSGGNLLNGSYTVTLLYSTDNSVFTASSNANGIAATFTNGLFTTGVGAIVPASGTSYFIKVYVTGNGQQGTSAVFQITSGSTPFNTPNLSGKIFAGGATTPAGTSMLAFQLQAVSVPEPSTFALAALGGLGLLWRRRRA